MRFRMARTTSTLTVVPGSGVVKSTTGAASSNSGLPLNGLLQAIIYTVPASVDASATMTISIYDQDGNIVWTKGSLAAGAGTTILNLTPNGTAGTTVQSVPLSGYYELRNTYTAAQTSTASVTKVVLLIDEG